MELASQTGREVHPTFLTIFLTGKKHFPGKKMFAHRVLGFSRQAFARIGQ